MATVGEFILKRLIDWKISRVFGYPGDGINGLATAFRGLEGKLDFIQARHEEMAAFMACGHAKFTGEVGVCMATSGPGAIHLLNGLYDAKLDHQPVVAIVGQTARTAMGGDFQQEVDLQSLFKDVAHEFVQTVMTPEQLPAVLDRAIRIARDRRTVTCLIVPADIQEMKAIEHPAHGFKIIPGDIGYSEPIVRPKQVDIERAAEIINAGKRVAILVGQGARNATAEVLQVADLLGAGIAKALLGKDVVPDALPFVTGSIGLLGTKPSYDMMMNCDTLLMIGSSFPYSQFLPDYGKARGVQIDLDGKMIGLRYPMEVNLIGDAAETLRLLVPLLKRKEDRSWQQRIATHVEQWWKLVADRAKVSANPINPQLVFSELSPRLPDNCILTCDSGSSANWYARDLKLRSGMRASLSGTLATMGPGVPYAIAAKLAFPERVVIAMVGDGAMQMNGTSELLTIKRYMNRWPDKRLIVMVLHNNDLNQVTWEMRAMVGSPKVDCTQVLPDFDYAAFAELAGLKGLRMLEPEDVGPVWDEALKSTVPVVIDAHTDPEVPPLPPHIEMKQALSMMAALMKGDPRAKEMIAETFKTVMA